MIALICIGLWIVGVLLILAFNYGAHQGDPEDLKG